MPPSQRTCLIGITGGEVGEEEREGRVCVRGCGSAYVCMYRERSQMPPRNHAE